MPQGVKDSILQEFSRNPGGQLCLCFSDPEYVRSEMIIFDRKDSSLHAVLDGASYFVGYANERLAHDLLDENEVILAAPHYFSGSVHLVSKVSVV